MAQQGSAIKCLVWDLDDTLWNGTLLEGDHVFIADEVRHTVEVLDSRGILQSIASKNDHDLAWSRLSELGVAEYFILPQICLESEVGRYLIYCETTELFTGQNCFCGRSACRTCRGGFSFARSSLLLQKSDFSLCMNSLNSIQRL